MRSEARENMMSQRAKEAAARISSRTGVPVDRVIKAYLQAAKKSPVNAASLFLG